MVMVMTDPSPEDHEAPKRARRLRAAEAGVVRQARLLPGGDADHPQHLEHRAPGREQDPPARRIDGQHPRGGLVGDGHRRPHRALARVGHPSRRLADLRNRHRVRAPAAHRRRATRSPAPVRGAARAAAPPATTTCTSSTPPMTGNRRRLTVEDGDVRAVEQSRRRDCDRGAGRQRRARLPDQRRGRDGGTAALRAARFQGGARRGGDAAGQLRRHRAGAALRGSGAAGRGERPVQGAAGRRRHRARGGRLGQGGQAQSARGAQRALAARRLPRRRGRGRHQSATRHRDGGRRAARRGARRRRHRGDGARVDGARQQER